MKYRGADAARPLIRGFGLLEAIVALVILAGAGAALFAWISQNLRDAARIEAAQARVAQQLTAQGLISGINPFVEPAGERRLGQLRVRWTSKLLAPLRASVPYDPMEAPHWQVGLYLLDVEVSDLQSGERSQFALQKTGLEHLRGVPGGPRPEGP